MRLGKRQLDAHYLKRRAVNAIALSLASIAAMIAFACLGWLIYTLISRGLPSFNWNTLSQVTSSPGGAGGLLNAIVGSFLISFTAIALGSPIGILVGIYLAEYHPFGKLSSTVRIVVDILLGIPSIIIGLFIYEVYVVPAGHFSGWAGCFALGIMVVPIAARITENIYLLVPSTMREAVLALGAPQWRLIQFIIAHIIKGGVLTGVLLALARIVGEAAPLLFTALNNQFWSLNMNQPMANLPTTIFNYAMSPYQDWQQLAWSGALLITVYVLFVNMISRYLIRQTILPH
jgi:phosphate transport system permease protein